MGVFSWSDPGVHGELRDRRYTVQHLQGLRPGAVGTDLRLGPAASALRNGLHGRRQGCTWLLRCRHLRSFPWVRYIVYFIVLYFIVR